MFVPLSIADDCHIQPEQEEEYPFTVCGQTIMLSAPFLPQPCPCCRNRGRKKYSSTTSSVRRKRKSAQGMDRPAAPQAVTSSLPCSSYGRIWRCLPMSRLLPYETIIKATHGYPEAVRTVLAHYDKYIKHFSKIDGHIYVEAEEYITQRLVESLLKFRLDRLPAFSKIASIMPCKSLRRQTAPLQSPEHSRLHPLSGKTAVVDDFNVHGIRHVTITHKQKIFWRNERELACRCAVIWEGQ